MKPSIGRAVHFVDGTEHRPATVTRVHSDTCVNLVVLNDGSYASSRSLGASFMVTSVVEDPEGKVDFSWHWPERVE